MIKLAGFIVLTSIALVSAGGVLAEDIANRETVLTVDSATSGPVYTINGRAIPVKKGLLLSLSEVRNTERDNNPEIMILVNENAKLSEAANLIGIAGKAGYLKYRLFVYGEAKEWMSQLTYSKPIPFSTQGTPRESGNSRP